MKLPDIFNFLLNIFSIGDRDKSTRALNNGVENSNDSLGYTATSAATPGEASELASPASGQVASVTPQRTSQVVSSSGRAAVASAISSGLATTTKFSDQPSAPTAAADSPPPTYGGFPSPSYGGFPGSSYGGFPAPDYGGFPTPGYGGFPDSSYGGFPTPDYGGFPAPSYGGFPTPSYGGFPTSSDYSVTTQVAETSDGGVTVMREAVKKTEPAAGWGTEAGTSPDPAAFVFEPNSKVDTDPLTIKDGKQDHSS